LRYGLLGEKLSHSFSPKIHSMLGNTDYGLFSVAREELDSFMRESSFEAINVTIPYKQSVIPYLYSISEKAESIGSVNTVVRDREGRLHGYNTDYTGLRYMLERGGISLRGKKVLILGSGGTSLTARAAAADMGAGSVTIISRRGEDNYENISRHRDAEVIINTTPVGMYPKNGEALISLSEFPRLKAVADVIYNPFYSELLLEARKKGIKYANGLSMLVAQAVAADSIFFSEERGAALPKEEPELSAEDKKKVEAIHGRLFFELSNLVLVGMPSSGKTTVGRELARELKKEFRDADTEIEEKYGASIPEIFEREGEQGFRDKESTVIRELSKERGLVISTGGGAVLREENRRALRQNAVTVFLKRDIEKLSLEGRPLSKSREELYSMYERRLPFYEEASDITVDNNGDIEETVRNIVEELKKYEAFGD
jgi:shikimate dehydrogenase